MVELGKLAIKDHGRLYLQYPFHLYIDLIFKGNGVDNSWVS